MGRGLPREPGGGQKVLYVPRNQGNQTLGAGYPRICREAAPEKFEEKKVCVQFPFPKSTFKIFILDNVFVRILVLGDSSKSPSRGNLPEVFELAKPLRSSQEKRELLQFPNYRLLALETGAMC